MVDTIKVGDLTAVKAIPLTADALKVSDDTTFIQLLKDREVATLKTQEDATKRNTINAAKLKELADFDVTVNKQIGDLQTALYTQRLAIEKKYAEQLALIV